MTPSLRNLVLAALLLIAACDGKRHAISLDADLDVNEAGALPATDDDASSEVDELVDAEIDEVDAASDQQTSDVVAPQDAGSERASTDAVLAPEVDARSADARAMEASSTDASSVDAAGASALDAASQDAAQSDSAVVADAGGADASSDASTRDASSDASTRDAAADWTCFGKDLANTRYNAAETRLSKASVPNLTRAWQVPGPGISATPAVVGDLAYWADWRGTVRATRINDGSLAWSQTFARGFTSSPCVSQNTLFVADRLSTVYALDLASGATRWATTVNAVALTHLWSSPIVVDGIVLLGLSADGTNADRQPLPAETINTFRGAVVGLDAQTGSVLWRFETTRVIGEASDRYGPGVSVWSSAAVDRARGLMYIGTGNSYGLPASPYSDALLAIRYRTGELAWSVQFTPNDAYSGANPNGGPDFDIGAVPNLFAIDSAGGPREVVGVGDKAGRYRVFDRGTGALVWERQLDPGFNLPGRKTGGIIAPAAVANGRIFVASNTSWHDSRVWALDANNGNILWNSATIDSVNFGGPAVANGVLFFGGSGFRVDESVPDSIGVGRPGDLIAFDVDSGTVLYRTKLYAGRGAGFSISQGRVFVGTGFTFYGYSDEPVDGALEAFTVP